MLFSLFEIHLNIILDILAIDIYTTSIICYLISFHSNACLNCRVSFNAQGLIRTKQMTVQREL